MIAKEKVNGERRSMGQHQEPQQNQIRKSPNQKQNQEQQQKKKAKKQNQKRFKGKRNMAGAKAYTRRTKVVLCSGLG
ncbi:hypothetical protein [Stenotrophomonas maltophilia]|uniref:hypothetical protein n=1 Tax=Stenotrophomonas maltophilia TaxID=40324 RepID=UPI0012FD72C9|nr:hypothetical protein [Stenotrophomonas maltophilia]